MSREATLISIPKEHLPAIIRRLLAEPGDNITKTQPLLRYEYTKKIKKQTIHPKTKEVLDDFVDVPFVEDLKSPAEGELDGFYVGEGDTISLEGKKPVVGVKEPCFHSVQLHGLCAICGNDMMKTDFTGVDYSQRATISMAHNVAGLTVSLSEAERLEKETSARLLKSRKLSLIVDLDQTLIHATVDPKVEEWMSDENNDTAKDIHKFVLPDSPTVYYIKLRPGLQEFLKIISDNYEPHIYTMGTRNYASSVANVIDPDKTIFNERILSRDESGSMTQKNIRRLFPCNDSMVVVIDDRADVWGWSPNLIKVHPYDFFVGIGDINDVRFAKPRPGEITQDQVSASTEQNSSDEKEQGDKPTTTDNAEQNSSDEKEQDDKLTPIDNDVKIESITESKIAQPEKEPVESESPVVAEENNVKSDEENSKDSVTYDEKTPKEPLKIKVENIKDDESSESLLKPPQNNKRMHGDDELSPEEKSLKRQQLERDKNNDDDDDKFEYASSLLDQEPRMENKKPVLVDNDTELPNLLKALKNIHKQYYEEYDCLQNNKTQENGERRTPDLTELIPRLKVQVLTGVNILFTHVIPNHQKKESSEIWILASEFGAQCSTSWNNKITHLVAGDRGTEKVREAKRKGNVFIVSKEWLDESIKKWERQPEKAFMLEEISSSFESESGQASEIEKLPDLNVETTDVTDEEGIFTLISSEKFKEIDWGDVMKEIDDEIGDSGDTSAFDESETESGTESGNGRKKLKRNSEVQLAVGEPYSKRIKQSPLRQSIMFNEEDASDEDDVDDEANTSFQEFDADGEPGVGFELSSDSFYQHSELQDEVQEDFQYDDDEYDDYDPGNQSDDEDSDDERFIHDFEESLKQDMVKDEVFINREKDDEHFGVGD